jgi:flotillin
MGFGLMAVGLLLFGGPYFVPALAENKIGQLVISCVGLLLFLFGLGVTVVTSLYRKTSADQAFVMTGAGGSRVVLDGGAIVLPVMHRITEVNLRTMKLGVNPRGANALITKDNLRSNILAQFYIRVQADREHILNAARSLGVNSVDAENVEQLVSEKLVSALRAIASQMELFEIHTRRDEFAERVKEHVKSDLEANGLLLESVTISELDQTDPSELSDNNVFDAQGKKKITEITAAAMVERNNLEREAERARKIQDVATRQKILELERQQAEAEAGQRTEIAKFQAEKSREAQEAVIAQERSVQIARIEKDTALEAAEIERQKTVETARVGQEKTVQAATIAREQELQRAGVERDQAVEMAQRVKQIAIANKETERAVAEEGAFIAQAAQEKAKQQVITVTQIAEADRDASKKLIAARQEIERDKIRQQTEAEVAAFTRVTSAQAEQDAATKQSAAKFQLAQAEAQAKEQVARGEKAQQMVAVEVARENVVVEQARVDVERRQLENRQEFAEAGIRLEVEKLRIQADKEVQQEFAKALGQFLSKGNMTLYGTPETAQKMMDNMAKGFGIRAMADGFLGGATPQNGANGHSPTGSGPSPVDNLIGSLGKLVGPVVEKLTGQPLDNEAQADAIAKALAGNPAALKAIADALGASDPTPVVKASEPIVVKSVSANGAVSEKPAVIVTSAGSEAN